VEDLDRAVALLGPLEGRVMRAVWTRALPEPFVVRDVLTFTPELAYTTVMTTVRRLADKGLLTADAGRRAHEYRATSDARQFLAQASEREATQFLTRYGEAGLAAFATRLSELTSEQRRRLEDLAQ
jgi:predicted transcriptional regulator